MTPAPGQAILAAPVRAQRVGSGTPDKIGAPQLSGAGGDGVGGEIEGECSASEFREWLKSIGFTDEGWIDDKGNFWPCDEHMMHGYIVATLLDLPTEKDAEKEADRRGWLRLSDYGNRTTAKRLNQRQLNTLFDYCQHHECDYHETLESIKHL